MNAPQSLEDQVIGWIKVYEDKAATQPATQDNRVYSAAQISITRLFATWMQAMSSVRRSADLRAIGWCYVLRNGKQLRRPGRCDPACASSIIFAVRPGCRKSSRTTSHPIWAR